VKIPPLLLSTTGRKAIDVVRQLTQDVTKIFVETIDSPIETESKGRGNVVTEIDYLIEKQSIELLQIEYPTFHILSEEKGETIGSADYTWILDPIDGTRNFVSGMPIFSFTIALMYKDQVVLGATLDPFRDELFVAELGQGTTLNGKAVQVGSSQTVRDIAMKGHTMPLS
jgi:myo-inositol-1(or 4)-monophosphatase